MEKVFVFGFSENSVISMTHDICDCMVHTPIFAKLHTGEVLSKQ